MTDRFNAGGAVGTERLLTEAEWRRREALRHCATDGHTWSIIQNMSDGPSSIRCEVCGWSGSVKMTDRPVS